MDAQTKSSWVFLNWARIHTFIYDNYLLRMHNDEFDKFESAPKQYCITCYTQIDVSMIYFSDLCVKPNTLFNNCKQCYHNNRLKGIRKIVILNDKFYLLNCYYKVIHQCVNCGTDNRSGFLTWNSDNEFNHLCEICANLLPAHK
jgi:hypothetical protein